MARSAVLFSVLSLAATLAIPAPARADTPPAAAADQPATAPAAAAQPQPATPAPRPKRDRPISDNLAASLAASMPKYNPPPKPKPEDEDVDLREVDKPKNSIIRLPKYTVREQKPPVFRERDIYSSQSQTDLALRRYAGLQFGPFSNLNRPVGLAMYQEQQRLNDMAELKDTARTVGTGDKAEGAYIKRLSDETFMRSGSSDLDSMGSAWSNLRK